MLYSEVRKFHLFLFILATLLSMKYATLSSSSLLQMIQMAQGQSLR